MYGTMSGSDTQLQVSITGTDGLCDLPTWFAENSTYQRTEAAAEYVLHEYIWLGGRPVAVVKTALDALYNRMTAKSCWRNDEYDACGTVYPVSDYLPKVVAVVDSAGRLAGAADYDAFGRVNEVRKRADVPAPRPGPATAAYPTGRYPFGAYTPNQNVDLAVLSQPWGSSRQRVQMRVNYAQVNTPGGMASSTDKTWVTLGSGAQVAPTPTPEDRWYAGRLYATSTNWFEAPANGDVRVKWASGPTQQSQEYTGATVRSYEYRRFELGAQPTWVALRFPGQYADAETGLFENWNRFYDPSTGRYTATDPMTPATDGSGLAPFPYASNNPLRLVDPDGRQPFMPSTRYVPMAVLGAATVGLGSLTESAAMKYKAAQEMAYLKSLGLGQGANSCEVPRMAETIMENGQGPVVAFAPFLGRDRANTEIGMTDTGWFVGKITISERFLCDATVEAIAHVIVHEVGHWEHWTDASIGEFRDPRDLSAFVNMRNEREYSSRAYWGNPNFPTEGYRAEWMVFGSILP
jgi:RHS repeat-associated protein